MPNDDRGLDGPDESATSFGSLPPPKATKYAWMPKNDKVNHEAFHRMLEEYRATKKREVELELKIKQLGAQLARTEEAAKRALVQTDATAKGGAAQRLLDSERAIAKLRAENAELASKLAREKKRSADFKAMADSYKQRLDAFLKDQRHLVKRVGELERSQVAARRKPEDEFWGEEAGRRFVAQQEDLVALKEENAALKELMESDGPLAQCRAYEGQINELQNLVKFYERKITAMAEAGGGGLEALGGPGNQPGPDDWVLEEFWHGDEMYLLDRKTGKLFTVPGDNAYPRPLGVRTAKEVRLGIRNGMERFLATLDSFLANNAAALKDVFEKFDTDNSGQLDRRELARLLQTLMPDLSASQVEELRLMLDVDGDGLISLDEMLEAIKEAFAARTAAKVGKAIEVNDALDRIRDVLRQHKQEVKAAFEELDADRDGCLSHLDAVRLVRKFLPDLYQKEVRYLLSKLQQWDVAGESKTSFEELYQALELARVFRVGQGLGGPLRTGSPNRSPARAGGSPTKGGGPLAAANAGHLLRASAVGRSTAAVGGGGMKEAFMRERVAQLEVELRDANRRNAELEDDAKKVELLQRDAALYRARIEELERDFMKVDVLGNLEAAGGDEQLQKAWEIASTFKKRFMEHKGELDNIRIMYARMQAQLDETHKLLHEEHRKRFRLEDEITRLNVELMRVGDLESRLSHEKGERVKLEREYLALQQKALSAPGEALAEVRALREELFAVKREKATAQQKEAEVRMELTHVRALLDGMDQTSYKAMQDDTDAMRKRVASLTLELQAARDKLAVYMKMALPNGKDADLLGDDDDLLFGTDKRPDADKTPEELRRELVQLRDVWRLDQGEIKKLHKVLETEAAITTEAKAALEEAHREMERQRRELEADLRKLEREVERREEKIRKLELQLRGAYSGINRALRSSKRGGGLGEGGLRDSLRSDTDDFSEIGEEQNIFELHVTEATVYEEALGKDPAVFFTFDFFMHESQATPIVASNAPAFNTTIQYVVDADPFLLEYMDTHVLELELCRARGYDYDVLGVARVPLRQVLEDLEVGAALGYNRAYHYADVFGADGKRLGRVRYGYAFRRPLDALLKEFRALARAKKAAQPDSRDPATAAVQQALTQPGSAGSAVKVIVERCEQLAPAGGTPLTMRPYVHYRFPGTRDYHDTRTLAGANPVFNDEAVWPIARTPALEADFKARHLMLVVFDDAQSDDPLRSIVGVAAVPLAGLAAGVPVEGAFKLTNPVTRKPSGRLVLGLGWHNPLALPGAPPKGPPPRVPISSEEQDGGLPPDFGLGGAGVQELLPLGGGGGSGARPGVPFGGPMQPQRRPPPHGGAAGGATSSDGHGLLAELGGSAAAGRTPSSSSFGFSPPARPQQQQQQQQPAYGQQQQPYGYPPQQQQGMSYGLAGEMAARQGQQPYAEQQQQQQQLRPPGSPYGGGARQQQRPPSDFGLAADVSRPPDQYPPPPPGPPPFGQQQMQQGLQDPSAFGYSQPPLSRGGSSRSGLSGGFGGPPEEYGLGAETVAAPPYGQGRPLGSLPPPPPPPPGGRPPLASPGGARYGGGQGGSRRPSDFGVEAEAAGPQRPGSRLLSRQASGSVQGPGGGGGGEQYGLGAEMVDAGPSASPPRGGMILSGRSSGRARYTADTEASLDPAPYPPSAGGPYGGGGPYGAAQQQQQQALQQRPLPPPPAPLPPPPGAVQEPVLRRENPDPGAWVGMEHRLLLCLHSLRLTPEALRNPRLRNLVLMHSLLSEGLSEHDFTQPMAKGAGDLRLDFAVSYNVLAGDAARGLSAAMSSPDEEDDYPLELKLMSTAAQRLDVHTAATPGTLQTVGVCILSLRDFWAAGRPNLDRERVPLYDDNDEVVAELWVSLRAETALRTLLAQTQAHAGGRR